MSNAPKGMIDCWVGVTVVEAGAGVGGAAVGAGVCSAGALELQGYVGAGTCAGGATGTAGSLAGRARLLTAFHSPLMVLLDMVEVGNSVSFLSSLYVFRRM